MTFTVVWAPVAEKELAAIWLAAKDRDRLTAMANLGPLADLSRRLWAEVRKPSSAQPESNHGTGFATGGTIVHGPHFRPGRFT